MTVKLSKELEVATFEDKVPYADDAKRVKYLYREAETFRPVIRGYTESKLRLLTAPYSTAEAVSFWFRSRASMQAMYLIMSNYYKRQGTPMVEFHLTVSASANTRREIMVNAEALEFIVVENIDQKSKIIWPTVRFVHIYEDGVMDHHRVMMDAMGGDYTVSELLAARRAYTEKVDQRTARAKADDHEI